MAGFREPVEMSVLLRKDTERFSQERQETSQEDYVLHVKECGLHPIWFGKGEKFPGPLSFLFGRAQQELATKASPLQREAGASCWKEKHTESRGRLTSGMSPDNSKKETEGVWVKR